MVFKPIAMIQITICTVVTIILLAGTPASARVTIPCCPPCSPSNCFALIKPAPHKHPTAAFFVERGFGGDAPCCGPTCSMVRCLEFNRLVLNSLGEPLEIERNGSDHGGNGDDGDEGDDGDDNYGAEVAEQDFEQLSLKLGGQKPIIPSRGLCCGRGCSKKSCFSYLLDFVVQVQYP